MSEKVIPIEQVDEDFALLIKRVLSPTYMKDHISAIIYSGHVYYKLFSGTRGAEVFLDEEKTMGRNSPCICGSGKKYKKCCGKI